MSTGKGGRIKPSPYNPRKIGNNIVWQLDANKTNLAVQINPEIVIEGYGPDIVLQIKSNIARQAGATLILTSFTHEELLLVKELFDNAFRLALEVSLGRDKRAEELSEDRDFPIERLTRSVPRLFASKRAELLDGKSLLQRPVNVFDDESEDGDKPG